MGQCGRALTSEQRVPGPARICTARGGVMLKLVTATRLSRSEFFSHTMLGKCLPRLGEYAPFALHLAHGNVRPLAEVYNQAIEASTDEDVLVFLHDDVRIDDWFLTQRLSDALKAFDVVGVAGNQRVQPRQVAWYLQPEPEDPSEPAPWDREHLSGAVYHGADGEPGEMSKYGLTPWPVRLLDGVFLATPAVRLKHTGVRFDPALAFHFYDLDFCLSAHRAGLRLGTWPIALTHASRGGSINTPSWRDARALYLRKWFP